MPRARKTVQPPAETAMPIDQEPVVRAGVRPTPTRGPTRAPVRETVREPARHDPRGRGVVVMGRDGEQLTRRRTTAGDLYHVPSEEIPPGWDYQWNVYTVLEKEMTQSQVMMHANGWRPVPAERHPGRWLAPGAKGAIVVNGLRLEERPMSLTMEAKAEDIAKARQQMRDQTDSLRLTEKLPKGMEANRRYRGTGADVRLTIDPGLDIPRPEHEIEE